MKIPNPKANYGDTVLVLNYRCNPPKWEQGELRTLAYKNGYGEFYWHYDVFINRGKKFFLYVCDDKIKRIS